ncbi:DUF6907 domain-containing protein [Streptomyces sp. NPDC002405]
MQDTVQTIPAAFTPPAELKPGHRLAPVKVGRTNATSVIVYIECPDWCTEDHVDDPVISVEDVMHRGDQANVYVPTFGYGAYPIQLHATIESDPLATDPQLRAAHVAVQDAGGNDYSYLNPEMAEQAADDLIKMAADLRQMARTARLANQTTGGPRGDLTPWTSLSRADLQALPIARLLLVFGVTVVETEDVGRKALYGQPGAMELHVLPSTPQHLRESQARRALLDWHKASARRG